MMLDKAINQAFLPLEIVVSPWRISFNKEEDVVSVMREIWYLLIKALSTLRA